MKPSRGVHISTALVAVAALAACGTNGDNGNGGDENPGADAPESIVVGQPADLEDPNALYDSSLHAATVFRAVYDQLFYMSADGELEPRIATEWSANGDATEWNIVIRDDITFHDGSEMTVDDIMFTFQTHLEDPEAFGASYIGNIEEMERVSDYELNIILDAPTADFAHQAQFLSIVPEQAYEEMGREEFSRAPVGSGPYEFVSFESGVSVELVRNDDYWGDIPEWEEVSIIPVTDDNSRLNGVQSGTIDLTTISPEQIEDAEAAGLKVQTGASNQAVFLGNNVEHEVLSDADIREAIALAVDRQALVSELLAGAAEPLGQTAPEVVTGHVENIEPDPYDPDEARSLVEAAGYDGEPIPFTYPTDGNIANSDLVAQSIAANLEDIGLNIDMQGRDWSTFLLEWNETQLPGLFFFQFSPSAMDASLTLNLNYRSGGYIYWEDEELDALIEEVSALGDEDERLEVFEEIWEHNKEQRYLIDLYNPQNIVAMTEWMNYEPRGDGLLYFPHAVHASE